MFSRFTRLPLRRCLHTVPPRPSQSFNRLHVTLAASASLAAFLSYRLFSPSHSIALDSDQNSLTQEPAVDSSDDAGSTSTEGGSTSPEGETTPDQAGSGGAFNPVTGEINWDCPCLGGMAHGPCGPQFREAFSCFVFSEDEPKGINCVEKFKAMQTCFREHPEIYADEIDDDDEDAPQKAATAEGDAPVSSDPTSDMQHISHASSSQLPES